MELVGHNNTVTIATDQACNLIGQGLLLASYKILFVLIPIEMNGNLHDWKL